MSNGGNGANAAEPGPQVSSGRNGRLNVGATVGLIVPLGAVVAALAVGAIMLLALGANPLDGYRAMFSGAVGGTARRGRRGTSALCVSSSCVAAHWPSSR